MALAELLGLSMPARAQGGDTLEGVLSVHPDADRCVTEPALRARVQRWLRPQPLAPELRVVVDAAAQPPRFSVQRGALSVAERAFDVLPNACSDRLDAIAIAVALAIEHAQQPDGAAPAGAPEAGTADATAQPPAPTAAEGAPKTAAPEKESAATPARSQGERAEHEAEDASASRARAAAEAARTRLYAGGGLLVGALPEPVALFALGADLALTGPLHLDLAALASTRSSDDVAGGTLHAQALALRALGCLGAPVGPLAAQGCAGAAAGTALASGKGYQSQHSHALGWVAPMVRGALRFPAQGTFAVRLAAAGILNAVRPRLVVSGAPAGAIAAKTLGAEASIELMIALP